MGGVEILSLALTKTDAGVILSGSADWIEPRKFDCENCGALGADGVRRPSAMKFVCTSAVVAARGCSFGLMYPQAA